MAAMQPLLACNDLRWNRRSFVIPCAAQHAVVRCGHGISIQTPRLFQIPDTGQGRFRDDNIMP